MKYTFTLIAGFLSFLTSANAQVDSTHYKMVERIFQEALTDGKSYDYLETLCNDIGPRLSGSPKAAEAVEYTADLMKSLGFNVLKREVMVPHWVRGDVERGYFTGADQQQTRMRVTALGGSIATDGLLEAGVVEVQNFGDLKRLGKEVIEGKIVFYNRPMNPVHLSTFTAYGGGVDQRWAGALEAAKYGAKGVLVRSLTLRLDTLPHTGSMAYVDSIPKIPAAAISTVDAEVLHKALQQNPDLKASFQLSCETLPEALSHNVIGEIKGSDYPTKYLVVGGHLDSWDLGTGAHDDGAGVVQSIEALRLLDAIGYKPKHTLRAVLFMNEENGLRGGKIYAERAKTIPEEHVMAVETDAGGSSPLGFRIDATPEQVNLVQSFRPYFEPYGIYSFKEGGSGADVGQLKNGSVLLAGLSPNSQRYFDYHHAASDVVEAVNPRELELGAAALAVFIYLIDQTIDQQ